MLSLNVKYASQKNDIDLGVRVTCFNDITSGVTMILRDAMTCELTNNNHAVFNALLLHGGLNGLSLKIIVLHIHLCFIATNNL